MHIQKMSTVHCETRCAHVNSGNGELLTLGTFKIGIRRVQDFNFYIVF